MIVIGDEPSTVKDVHEAEPAQLAVVVAVADNSPPDPIYVRPCESDGRKRDPMFANVDDDVTKDE